MAPTRRSTRKNVPAAVEKAAAQVEHKSPAKTQHKAEAKKTAEGLPSCCFGGRFTIDDMHVNQSTLQEALDKLDDTHEYKKKCSKNVAFLIAGEDYVQAKQEEIAKAGNATKVINFTDFLEEVLTDAQRVKFMKHVMEAAEQSKTTRKPRAANGSTKKTETKAKTKKSTTKSNKKSTKKAAEDKPEKKLNPYLTFCKENREKVKKANKDLTFGEIAKELGRIWSEKTPTQKLKYAQD